MLGKLLDIFSAARVSPNDSRSLSYRTQHFCLEFKGGPAFASLDGKPLIDALDLSYTTCNLYNIKVPLTDARRIVLDHLDGLTVGDKVLVANNMYGGSAVPTYQVRCVVTALGLNSITLDRDLPKHILRYSNGLIVLRRSSQFKPLSVGDARLERVGDGAVCSYLIITEHFRMECGIRVFDGSPRVEIRTATTFTKPSRLYNLSFSLGSRLEITELFLKNRVRCDTATHPIKNDLWLWKEGCRASAGPDSWVLLHNPGLASVELLTAGHGFGYRTTDSPARPTPVLNLEHYSSQHFRRHKENLKEDYSFSTFEDMSLPAFEEGSVKEHVLGFYVGSNLSSPPRLMLAPKGFRAVHVWTEHADKTTWETQCAVYYGEQNMESAANAVGGFVKYNHPVTKSVFYDNPRSYQNSVWLEGRRVKAGEMLSYKRSEKFRTMLDELSRLRCEVCIHALAPVDSFSAEEVNSGIFELATRYKSPTWIDHGMQDVRPSVGWQGLTTHSGYYLGNTLIANGIRFFWSWSSTDFMPKNKQMINLLHIAKAEYMPTPLYWRHPALLDGMVIWASHEAPLDAFSEQSLDELVQERGVSIHQHYYPYLIDDRYQYGFIERDDDGRFAATSRFNKTLASMAGRRDAGELYLTTIGDIVKYWLDLESVTVDLRAGGFALKNQRAELIPGLAFVVHARTVSAREVMLNSRPIDNGDLLVWFDMPGHGHVEFDIEEPQMSTAPESKPATGSAETLPRTSDIDWLLNKEKGFVLVFRPRCGSTTLTRWFFENMGVKFGGFSISAYRNEWLEPRLAELQDYLDAHYADLHKFVVVRDPIDRAVSSYFHVVNNPQDSQWNVVKPFVHQGLHKHDLTFRQWVDYLGRIDLDHAHIIWRRQSALSCWERGVDDVVRLESMNDYLLKMNERFGLEAKPTFNSVTVPQKEKRHPKTWWRGRKFYGDTPFSELLRFKGKAYFQDFPDYSHFYDSSLRRSVEQLYQRDIEIFRSANVR